MLDPPRVDASWRWRSGLGFFALMAALIVLPLNANATSPTLCTNWIDGTNAGDILIGTDDAGKIFGRGGHDLIKAKAGDDCVFGGSGG